MRRGPRSVIVVVLVLVPIYLESTTNTNKSIKSGTKNLPIREIELLCFQYSNTNSTDSGKSAQVCAASSLTDILSLNRSTRGLSQNRRFRLVLSVDRISTCFLKAFGSE